jgi:hypothetical protein
MIVDILDAKDALEAAQDIYSIMEKIGDCKKSIAILWFVIMESERNGCTKVAEVFKTKAEGVLNNVEMLNQLNVI